MEKAHSEAKAEGRRKQNQVGKRIPQDIIIVQLFVVTYWLLQNNGVIISVSTTHHYYHQKINIHFYIQKKKKIPMANYQINKTTNPLKILISKNTLQEKNKVFNVIADTPTDEHLDYAGMGGI